MIRSRPGKAVLFLSKIIQAKLDLKYSPSSWKQAEIIPIPKPNKSLQEPQNYRPISLISILAKLEESFFLQWINDEINRLNFLPNHQFGFRKQHSVTQQTARVYHYIKEKLKFKKATGF